jgi:hypothetical protein
MFADMELIGIPHRVVIGERGLKEGQLEYKGRTDADATMVARATLCPPAREAVRRLIAPAVVWRVGAFAGAQKYEVLSASAQAALHKAVSDSRPPVSSFKTPMEAVDWLAAMSPRLEKRIPTANTASICCAASITKPRAPARPAAGARPDAGRIGFRKYAVSSAGARGYMQVMPFWVKLIGRPDDSLFDLRTNLRYGCTILRHYLDIEKGDLFRALGRYNGSLGKPEYPTWFAPPGRTSGIRPGGPPAQAETNQRPPPIPGIMPFMPRISLPMPPLENCFIIFCVCSNWLSRRLTS